MNIHELKIEWRYSEDVREGRKTFEIRKNDRGFAVGDLLVLRPVNLPTGWRVSARATSPILARVKYILEGGAFGLEDGYVAMSIERVTLELVG